MINHNALREAAHCGPKAMINTADLLALLADYDALVSAAANSKPKRKAAKKAASTAPELPAWLPLEAWEAFLAMRVKIKKPATDYAQKIILRKLESFRSAGHEPVTVLEQSIANGWQDIYLPKENGVARGYDSASGRPVQVSARQRQQAQANQEALDRLAGVPMFDPTIIDVEATYAAD